MASFLKELVDYAEKADVEDLKDAVSTLTKAVYDLKCDVCNEIKNTYLDFTKLPSEHPVLVHRLQDQSQHVNNLLQKADTLTKRELESSVGELQTLSTQLSNVCLMLSHSRRLMEMDVALQAITQAHESHEFPQAARHLKHLQILLEDIPSEDESIKIYKGIQYEKRLAQERLLYDMHDLWRTCLRWEEPELNLENLELKENPQNQKRYCAALHVDAGRLNELEGTFIALSALNSFDFHLSKFCSNFMRLILRPLATETGQVMILTTEGAGEAVLEVETFPNKPKPTYTIVLENMRKVFGFVRQYLTLHVEETTQQEINMSLVKRMGCVMGDELCELLVKGCLGDTVPVYGHSAESFKQAAAEAEDFNNFLRNIGFLSEEHKSLLKYASNIDVLFANKVCELHLEKARDIARRDLHDTMEVGPVSPQEPLPERKEDPTDTEPSVKLSDNTFQFPKCLISKSVDDLVSLLRHLLEEAQTGSDINSGRLIMTARKAVELYWAVSQAHHKEMLTSIPQIVALFHNNFMYLAHHLITLGVEYSVQGYGICFLDQVQGLREHGADALLKCLHTIRQDLITTLRESGLTTIGEGSSLPSTTEKAMRQCLRQFEVLRSVWGPVLPENTYCKTIGILMNAMVEELVIRIVTLEDIPAHIATELADMFSDVMKRAPKVFPDPREVHRHVNQWHRLQALVQVLKASLNEIADHWASGAGPLAQAFSANELKQLVRALFQNNKRRAAILAQIKS